MSLRITQNVPQKFIQNEPESFTKTEPQIQKNMSLAYLKRIHEAQQLIKHIWTSEANTESLWHNPLRPIQNVASEAHVQYEPLMGANAV